MSKIEAHVSSEEQLRPSDRSSERATLTTRDNKGDETEGGRMGDAGGGKGGTDIKGDFTVQIKIYHNRKGLRGNERSGGDVAQRYLRFLICKAVLPSPRVRPPPRLFAELRARERPGMNKH